MLDLDFLESPKIHNFFDFECRDVNTGEILQTAHAENVVLDKWYNAMITSNDPSFGVYKIAIGSNGDTPSKTDTGLKNFIGSGGLYVRDASQLSLGGTGVVTFNGSWEINASTYVGQYFREVGAANYSGDTSKISTRAILKDSNGNPLEILKTDTMVVTVYSTVYIVIPETINGYKYRPGILWNFYDKNYSISFLAPFANIVFSNRRLNKSWKESIATDVEPKEWSQSFTASYTADSPNKLRTFSLPVIQASEANFPGGIRSVRLNGLEIPIPNEYFTQAPIIKEVVGSGDGIKKEFNTEFGWIRDNGTLHVYINDVETFDFVANHNIPPITGNAGILNLRLRGTIGSKNHITENLFPNLRPIKSLMYTSRFNVDVSNDLTTWTLIGNAITGGVTFNIPSEYQNYKYWRFYGVSFNDNLFTYADTDIRCVFGGGDIVFNTPPNSGATVAITYQPDCIAKNNQKLIKNISYKIGLDY